MLCCVLCQSFKIVLDPLLLLSALNFDLVIIVLVAEEVVLRVAGKIFGVCYGEPALARGRKGKQILKGAQ